MHLTLSLTKQLKSYPGTLLTGLVFVLIFAPALVAGPAQPAEVIEQIRIVTPQWEGQTNPDGSGLLFDIIRSVYAPEGIQMVFVFAPWQRCMEMVRTGSQDAMLCVWPSHARDHHQLIPKVPLYIEHTAAVVKKASGLVWKGIHSLDYRRAVWLKGYDYHRSAQMSGIQLSDWHEEEDRDEAWHQLDLDLCDAYIDALIDIRAYFDTGRAEARLYNTHLLWTQKAYAAFSDSARSRQLIRIYDRQAAAMVASGRMAEIHRRWGQPFDAQMWAD